MEGPSALTIFPSSTRPPQLQRLLLALLLLAADVGDAVIHHLRPALEGLAGAGDGLIGADQDFVQAVLLQGVQGRDVALERTVALHGDEAPAGAQALALGLDHRQMVRVDLRDYHGYIVGPPVGGVVGDDGALQSRVFLLQGPDLLFLHVHGAEAEIHHGGQPLRVLLRVQDHQIFGLLRHGGRPGPSGPPPPRRKVCRRCVRWRRWPSAETRGDAPSA